MKTTKNYTNYLKQEKKDLIEYSKKIEDNTRKFKERIEIINTQTQNLIKLKHDPLSDQKDNYLWFVYNQKLLEEKMTKDGGYTTLFVTLTLPSSYHKYSSHTKKYNKNYDKNNTINKGYQLLNSSFRTIYKNFRVDRKHKKIFFSKVVEPHKDMTPHLHSLFYVKTKYVEQLKKHIKKTIKNNDLGMYDIEEIKDIGRSSSYLLKYVQKTTNPQDEKSFHFFNGWKKKNKIRVFTHSNLDLPRYIFKKVNSILKLSKGLKDKNPISKILENCDIIVNTKNNETRCFSNSRSDYKCFKNYSSIKKSVRDIKTKEYGNINGKYKIIINKTRSVYKTKEKTTIYNEVKFNDFINISPKNRKIMTTSTTIFKGEKDEMDIDIDELLEEINIVKSEKIYNYKINNFTIVDLSTNETLYNKNDFMLLDDYKYKTYLNK